MHIKLMDIDSDTLRIPDTAYDASVTMPSSEFSRIVRDLSQLGESVRIEVSKEGVHFSSDEEAANGNVLLKQTKATREKYANYGKEDEEDAGMWRMPLISIPSRTMRRRMRMRMAKMAKARTKRSARRLPTRVNRQRKPKSQTKPKKGVNTEMNQHVSFTFSLKCLVSVVHRSAHDEQ